MHAAYEEGVARLAANPRLSEVARGGAPRKNSYEGQAALFATDVEGFRSERDVQEEVFGAASVLVRCPDAATMRSLIDGMEGQLTATIQLDDPADLDLARTLLPALERKVGRILINGWPTGVEVSHAMVHGGPYPSTSDGRSTSVGTLAIRRFLRPVCYQDWPEALLPDALRDANPLDLWRTRRRRSRTALIDAAFALRLIKTGLDRQRPPAHPTRQGGGMIAGNHRRRTPWPRQFRELIAEKRLPNCAPRGGSVRRTSDPSAIAPARCRWATRRRSGPASR